MMGTHTWLLSVSLALGHLPNIGVSKKMDWIQGLCNKLIPFGKKPIQKGRNTPCPAIAGQF